MLPLFAITRGGSTKCTANRDRVTFSDQVLSGELGTGEGAKELREEVFVRLETLNSPGGIVKHEVRGTQLSNERRVLPIQALFSDTTCQRLVMFG